MARQVMNTVYVSHVTLYVSKMGKKMPFPADKKKNKKNSLVRSLNRSALFITPNLKTKLHR